MASSTTSPAPLAQTQQPIPLDYYARDHPPLPAKPQQPTIPIDFYVADRTAPPQGIMAAGQQYPQQQPPPYPQGPPSYPTWPGPQGTPISCLGGHPAPVVCPNCHHSGVTAVEYSSGGFTHALAALFCFVTCLGCIPYFFTGVKDATHKCANCGIPLATYHRSGRTEPHLRG